MGNLFGLKNKIFSVDSISTKITFNNKHKLLTGFLALVLVAGMASPAYASLIGDTAHVKVTNVSQQNVLCDTDVVIVDPGAELDNCGAVDIDINGDSIWFTSDFPLPNGIFINELLFEFTDLNWINSQGIITGVELFETVSISMLELNFTDDSVTLHNDEFTLDCGGPNECLLEFHIDIETDHPIGGTVGSMSTTSLLVAGAQANMGLWSLALVGMVAAGAAITYKLKSKKTKE